MPSKIIFILSLFFCAIVISPSQNWGILMDQYANKNTTSIKKIMEFEYYLPVSDSNLINPDFPKESKPTNVEYYEIPDCITRKEYLNSDGTIRSAKNYIYEQGKLVEEIGDTLFKNSILKKKINYLPSGVIEKITLYKNGKTEKYYIKEECNGIDFSEYWLTENYDTSLIIKHLHNDKNLYFSMIVYDYKEKKRINQSIFIYDDKDRIAKSFLFDEFGNMKQKSNYVYELNKTREIACDLITNLESISELIDFKDEYGNIYKQYYKPDNHAQSWKVSFFKIDYK
ncbi:MAG: hypothetical protein ACM3PT_11270 [Deltaproteobacteria bacterium]